MMFEMHNNVLVKIGLSYSRAKAQLESESRELLQYKILWGFQELEAHNLIIR
jgi:hypothetical protein